MAGTQSLGPDLNPVRADIMRRRGMNSQLAGQNTEAGILARLIQTRQDDLSRDAANYLLSLRFDDKGRLANERTERTGPARGTRPFRSG
jgi:hypothetical protein